MVPEYLLGIDSGSTVSKAAIFDLEGREILVSSRPADIGYPHAGWTERDTVSLWSSTAGAIREVVTRSGIPPAQIVGVGATGHGNGMYLLDKEGIPLRPGIVALDTRAVGIVDEWNAAELNNRAFPLTLQAFWAGQPNALLAWMKRHEPQAYAHIGAVLMVSDVAVRFLTGAICSSYSMMSGTSLMDVARREYSGELLELFGIPEVRAALPPLAESFDIVGRVTAEAARQTGLAQGTPVVAGMYDIDASAVGAGVVNSGKACIVAGSWSINEVISERPLNTKDLLMIKDYCIPGLWINIDASPTSATNLEWFIRNFCFEERAAAEAGGVSVYDLCSQMVESLPPADNNVIFHPFLFGSNVQSSARAGFYGLAGWHTKAHLLRALYEGVVFGHLSHMDKLRAAGAHMDIVRLTGGASRSHTWAQVFADVIELPMEVPDGVEVGAKGAALSAGIGAGVYRDYSDAAAQAVSVSRVHVPNPDVAADYRARYLHYTRLIGAMEGPWEGMAGLAAGH